jgi:hypothetical protein
MPAPQFEYVAVYELDHRPPVIPVHLRHPAHRTGHRNIPGPSGDPDHRPAVRHILDDQRR